MPLGCWQVIKGFGQGAALGNTGNDFFVTAAPGLVTHFTVAGVTARSSGDCPWG